jgi:NAD(P)H-hydrate repair Nnr-like enzyme with NAD(P)H-hydrate epimerase domain
MELAGLACAQALAKVYHNDMYRRVLVCCGPGNQGMFERATSIIGTHHFF